MKRSVIMKPLTLLTFMQSYTAASFAYQETKVLPSLDNATSVGVTYIQMIDKNRLDPFTNYTQQRQVMISLYYPAQPDPSNILLEQRPTADDRQYIIPYMPALTAALYDELVVPFGFPKNIFE